MIYELFKHKRFIIDNSSVGKVFRFARGSFVCLLLIIFGLFFFLFEGRGGGILNTKFLRLGKNMLIQE